MGDLPAARFSRDMGLTRREFLRTLPAALGGLPHRVDGGAIEIDHPQGSIAIELGATGERRIASMVLPVTPVHFDFGPLDAAARQAFMARFDLYFHRGGG